MPLTEGLYDVARIVDGGTLIVRRHGDPDTQQRGSAEGVRVRLLGVECPEQVNPDARVDPWAREAADFTAAFVAGQPVRLRLDKRRVDADGTYLAYVSVDGQMLNEQLLRHGLARSSIFPGDSEPIARRLRAAEQEARDNRRGLWSAR
jgi:micrococcal nuclease